MHFVCIYHKWKIFFQNIHMWTLFLMGPKTSNNIISVGLYNCYLNMSFPTCKTNHYAPLHYCNPTILHHWPNTQITTLSSWPPITKIPSHNHAQNQINKALNPTKFQHLPLTSKPRANSNTNVMRHIDFESDECLL